MNKIQYKKLIDMLDRDGIYITEKFIYVRYGSRGPIYRLDRYSTDLTEITYSFMLQHGQRVKEVQL